MSRPRIQLDHLPLAPNRVLSRSGERRRSRVSGSVSTALDHVVVHRRVFRTLVVTLGVPAVVVAALTAPAREALPVVAVLCLLYLINNPVARAARELDGLCAQVSHGPAGSADGESCPVPTAAEAAHRWEQFRGARQRVETRYCRTYFVLLLFTLVLLIPVAYFGGLVVRTAYVTLVMVALIAACVAFSNVYFGAFFTYLSGAAAPKPFHPDRCNGYARFGDYAVRHAGKAALQVVMPAGVLLYSTWSFEPRYLWAYAISVLALMPAAFAATLVAIAWRPHRRLRDAKKEVLGAAGRPLEEVLAQADAAGIAERLPELRRLQKRYRRLERECHTWPFAWVTVARTSGPKALIPFAAAVPPVLKAVGFG